MTTFQNPGDLARRLLARPDAIASAFERAELVRLVRDRGLRVRELAGAVSYGVDAAELDDAIAEHSRAVAALDRFNFANAKGAL